ncbi:MAG: sugar phosphate isomerase/epimerase [Candidatus Sumerlaeota bacterium]|nr:sugar phosphate isomerase/epimerase [Candidatus Sumerlaeota bacterium]
MQIGIINALSAKKNVLEKVQRFGLRVCQLSCWDQDLYTEEIARNVAESSKAGGVRVCALWAGYPGEHEWNFTRGPATLGLVPPELRAMRIAALKKGADFARKIGAPAMITHCGFIPENMNDPLYEGTVAAVREVAAHAEKLGLGFWFETGQETPVVLLRVMQDVGTGNLGINLDPANLILYGKGNPVDSLDVFGASIRNVHIKDGRYPTDGRNLGKETRIGEGKVDFPVLFRRLREKFRFDGELIIERETQEGAEQDRDIREAVEKIKGWGGVI